MAENSNAASATLRPMGPSTARSSQPCSGGTRGTRPGVGRKPTTPQKLAGLRNDPPRSLPSATGSMPLASAVAAPPLEPPQVRAGSQGLRVLPKTGLKVCEPAPNSGVFVLPMTTAPAPRIRSTIRASRSGTLSAKIGEPRVVRMSFVGTRSLIAVGRPRRGFAAAASGSRRRNSSAARACSRAWSRSSVQIALSSGLRRSIQPRWASSTSTAETSPRASSPARSTAVRVQRSGAPSHPVGTVTRRRCLRRLRRSRVRRGRPG